MRIIPKWLLGENTKITNAFDKTKSAEEKTEDFEKMGASEYEISTGTEYYFNAIYGTTTNKLKHLNEYREMAMFPEVAEALDEIGDEGIVHDDQGDVVSLQFEDEKLSKNANKVKNIQKEFDYIVNDVLNFNNNAFNLFRKFYVEAELFGEMVINPKSPKQGIKRVVLLPSETVYPQYDEYHNIEKYIQKVDGGANKQTGQAKVVEFSPKQIAYINSGIFGSDKAIPLSFIERAKIAYRQLKWMEDALVIYRIVRAPERRVFTIDVGNLPKKKAEQYMKDIIRRYKQKKIYNPATGEVDVGKQVLSMIEDYWLPKRADGSGPSVDVLSGGTNLGEIDDVLYFVKKLYKALKVPTKRLEEGEATYSHSGKDGEISREEIKFAKYVYRVRNRFMDYLRQIFFTHLKLTGLWKQYKLDENSLKLIFNEDNEWRESKKLANWRERLDIYREMKEYAPEDAKPVFSDEYLLKEILKLSDDDIKDMQKQIKREMEDAEEDQDGDDGDDSGGNDDKDEKPPKDDSEEEPEEEPEEESVLKT